VVAVVYVSRIRTVLLMSLAAALVLGAVGCAEGGGENAAPESPETEESPAPEEEDDADSESMDTNPDRTLVESTCSGCHDLAQVWAAEYDRAGWEAVVTRMESNGLEISDDDRARVIEYLAGGSGS